MRSHVSHGRDSGIRALRRNGAGGDQPLCRSIHGGTPWRYRWGDRGLLPDRARERQTRPGVAARPGQ